MVSENKQVQQLFFCLILPLSLLRIFFPGITILVWGSLLQNQTSIFFPLPCSLLLQLNGTSLVTTVLVRILRTKSCSFGEVCTCSVHTVSLISSVFFSGCCSGFNLPGFEFFATLGEPSEAADSASTRLAIVFALIDTFCI